LVTIESMALSQTALSQLEVVCDHVSSAGPTVTHVRGTVLVSSLLTLKAAGHYDRYVELLPREWHEPVLFALASSWLPIELGLVHYQTCEALALDNHELTQIGELLATRYADTFLGTILQKTRDAGVNAPWIALRAQPRIWERMYMGGGVKIYRTGPKDALGEFSGLPLARFRYFRVAFAGYYQGLANMFVRSAYVTAARPMNPGGDTFAITGSWV